MQTSELEEYLKDKLAQLDWNAIIETMHQHDFIVLEKLLTETQCDLAKSNYDHPMLYRKTVNMQRYRFGLGILYLSSATLDSTIANADVSLSHADRECVV